MATVLSIDLITSDPKVRSGRPVIAGTGVCVSDIVALMIYHQRTVDEIAGDYKLSLGQVHAALAYYYTHKAEIDEEIRRRDALDVELKEQRVGRRHPPLFR